MGRKSKKRVSPLVVLECGCCGENKPETKFLLNRWSKIYDKKRVPLCKDCVDKLFEENTYRYGEKMALYLTCAALDIPYISERYEKIIETIPPFTLGKYIKQLQINQYKNSSFAQTVADGDVPTAERISGKYYATAENVDTIRAEIVSVREELRDLQDKLMDNVTNLNYEKGRQIK